MVVGYLNERTQKIIDMLLRQGSVLRIRDISRELSVSTRTVYNELEKANEWLKANKLPPIQIIRGKVTPFTEQEKPAFEKIMPRESSHGGYIYAPGERTRMIVCQIIVSIKPVHIEELMNTCLVSRNTIFTDLQAAASQLNTWQLQIRYDKKEGYQIDGDSIRRRAIFFLYFNMLESLLSIEKLDFLHMEKIVCSLKQIECVEKELGVSYVPNDMLALAAMLPIMETGKDVLHFSDVSIWKVQASKEYQLVKKYFPTLPDLEKVYLTLHFLGGRLSAYSKAKSGAADSESVMEVAKNLISEFERTDCVVFEQKEELLQQLCGHISSSLYRYQFGIQIGNPMAEDIRREYPYLFDITRITVQYLEQQIGVQISDSEVAYLVLHFGAHLESAKRTENKLRILVVCVNGIATGNMISHELRHILPQAKITGVQAASRLVNPQNICDLIVSSVSVKALVPVIIVNPILNDFDRRNILNHPLIRSSYGFVDMEALFRVIKKYVLPENYTDLRRDLEKFLIQGREGVRPVLNPNIYRLTDFLTADRIIYLNSYERISAGRQEDFNLPSGLSCWETVLYSAAFSLLRRGSISEVYIRCMIERIVEAGPLICLLRKICSLHMPVRKTA